MSPARARLLKVALLVLVGVLSVQLFGWECSTRRADGAERPIEVR